MNKTIITYSSETTINVGNYSNIKPGISITKEIDKELNKDELNEEYEYLKQFVDTKLRERTLEAYKKMNKLK